MLILGNARPCVANDETDKLAVELGAADGDTSFLSVFIGIVKQLGEYFQQTFLIGNDMQTVRHVAFYLECDGIWVAERDGLCR